MQKRADLLLHYMGIVLHFFDYLCQSVLLPGLTSLAVVHWIHVMGLMKMPMG